MTDNVYTPGAQGDENPAETSPETTQFEAATAENVSSAADAPQGSSQAQAPTQAPAQPGPFNYAAPQAAAPQPPLPAAAPAPHAPYTPDGAHPTQPTEPYFRPQTDAFGNPVAAPADAAPSLSAGRAASASAAPKRRTGLAIGAALAIGALLGGASGAGVTAIWAANQHSTVTGPNADGNGSVVVNDSESVNEITAVAAKAAPSVVTLQVAGQSAAGSGSGVILSEDGYVLTNAHVVTLDGQSGDPTIQVTLADGSIHDATIVGVDPVYDLAVVKLEGATGLTPIEFADSDKLNVGDIAIAIGAPLGLSGTVTNGIVSALNRSITVASSAVPETTAEQAPDSGDGEAPFDFWNFDKGQGTTPQAPAPQQGGGSISLSVIQTDAAINPGNSGGALVDSTGKLIGINVAIAGSESSSGQAGNIGVGFSIPSNIAKRVADELIASGEATHGLLGASVTDAEADAAATTTGALIKEVSGGGAAEAAGLEPGDVVTNFGGVPITSANDLTAQVRGHASGSEVELRYVRGGDVFTATVTLGALSI